MTNWLIWLGGFSLLWLPGVFLHRLLRLPTRPDWLVTLALQLGLGLALWPLLLLWTTQIGWRWTPLTAQAAALALIVAGLAALLWAPGRWASRLAQASRQAFTLTLFTCIAAITAVTRLLQVRDLALPVWVDPVHHVAIVRLLLAEGAVPATFAPVIPGGVFNYHWGYHALVAWLAWLLGALDAFAVADITLHFSQLLNVLTVVMFYAAARVIFASRRAGLLAAAGVGVVSWFPAYFLSWGRYTQMTGVLLAVPALLVLWRLRGQVRPGGLIAATLLVAGLALVHVRVAFLAVILAGVLGGVLLFQRRGRTLLWWLAAAGGALLITLPWWLWLAQSAAAQALVAVRTDGGAGWDNYNLPDWGLVWAPRNPLLVAVSSLGLSALFGWQTVDLFVQMAGAVWLALLVGLGAWAWRRPALRPVTVRAWGAWLLLAVWVALTAVVLQANRFGLPFMQFIHVNVGVIALYAPLTLASGGLLAWVLGLLAPPRFALSVAGATALALTFWGASGMTAIVNPVTVLATPADRAALQWIRDRAPVDARFAVNTWEWLNGTYAGSDGGYWIPVLTDRTSVAPPALYAAALPTAEREAINARLARLAAATNLDDPALRAELAAQGVTHLYLGTRPGALKPEQIDGKPYARLVYREGGVSVYELMLE